MQPTYFVLPELGELYRLAEQDIMAMVAEARRLGLRPPVLHRPAASRRAELPAGV